MGGKEGCVVSQTNSTFGVRSWGQTLLCHLFPVYDLHVQIPLSNISLPVCKMGIDSVLCRAFGRISIQVCDNPAQSWAQRKEGSPTFCVASGTKGIPQGRASAKFQAGA